jgi:hypothetical protein
MTPQHDELQHVAVKNGDQSKTALPAGRLVEKGLDIGLSVVVPASSGMTI